MPTNLTGQAIANTYGQLLHVDAGVTSTRKTVVDGDGTASALKVATTSAAVAGELVVEAANPLKLADADSSNTVGIKAPATVAADVTLTLPATAGTSGQFLRTDGTGILSWADLGGAFTGVVDTQTFNSSGTWTKPSVGTLAIIRCWGGGGSGGKGVASAPGGGGGGSGFTEKYVLLSDLPATVSATVGAGGASQTTASTGGNAGGTTTFGSYAAAYGGGGGGYATNGGGGGGGGGSDAVGANASGNTPGGGGNGTFEYVDYLGTANSVIQSGTTYTSAIVGGRYSIASKLGGGGRGGAYGTALGGCCGSGNASAVTNDYGGAGGGGGIDATNSVNGKGGNAVWGGAGGGGGANAGVGGAGGTSTYGGAGGAGAIDANNAGAGVQPGGGGGGTEGGNSGAGGAGRVVVLVV